MYLRYVTDSTNVENYLGCLKRSTVMYIQKGSHTRPVNAIPT
jgi:hypothetical protein